MTTGRPVFPSVLVDGYGNPQEGVDVTVYVADPGIAFDDLDAATIDGVLDLATVYTDESGETEGDNPFTSVDGNVWPVLDVGDYVAEANGALLRLSSVGNGAVASVDGQTGAVDLSAVYAETPTAGATAVVTTGAQTINGVKDFNVSMRLRGRLKEINAIADYDAAPGTECTAELQNWLDACKDDNLPGYLPPDADPYNINATLAFTQKAGASIKGLGGGHPDIAGTRSRLRWTGTAGGTMLLLQGVRNSQVADFMLDGNSLAGFGLDYDAETGGVVTTENRFDNLTIVRCTDRGLRIGKSAFQTDVTDWYSCVFFGNGIGTSIEDANAVWHEFFGCRWLFNEVGITSAFAGTGGQFNIHGGRFLQNTDHDIHTFATRSHFINAQSEQSNRFLLGHGSEAYAGAPVTLSGCAVMTVEAADRIGIQWNTASPLVIDGGHFFSNDPAKSFKFGMASSRRALILCKGAGFDGNPVDEGNIFFSGVVRMEGCNIVDVAGAAGTANIGTLDGAIPIFTPTTASALTTVTAGAPGMAWAEMMWFKVPSGTALTTGTNTFYASSYHSNSKCRFEVPHITSMGGADAVLLGVEATDNDAGADQSVKVSVRVSAGVSLGSDLIFALRVRPEPVKYL